MISCPSCKYFIAKKNGHTRGKQRYMCKSCGYQFTVKKHDKIIPVDRSSLTVKRYRAEYEGKSSRARNVPE